MSNADCRQRDRVALSKVLQELAYLRLTQVRRQPNKPKRPSADKIDQAKAAMNGDAAEEDRTQETAAPEKTRDTSVLSTRTSADSSCPAKSSLGQEQATAKSQENLLATSIQLGTMQARNDARTEETAPSRASPPRHGVWAILTWLRRIITPPLSRRKAAKIK